MPQRRTRAAPYPSLCSTCRRVNYQQFHQGMGILWLHLQIASVQKLRSLLYAVPQVLRFSHFCDLMSIVCLICHIKHSGIDAFKCPGWQPAFVLTAQSCYRILPPTTYNRLDEDCRNETLQLVEERYNIIR